MHGPLCRMNTELWLHCALAVLSHRLPSHVLPLASGLSLTVPPVCQPDICATQHAHVEASKVRPTSRAPAPACIACMLVVRSWQVGFTQPDPRVYLMHIQDPPMHIVSLTPTSRASACAHRFESSKIGRRREMLSWLQVAAVAQRFFVKLGTHSMDALDRCINSATFQTKMIYILLHILATYTHLCFHHKYSLSLRYHV